METKIPEEWLQTGFPRLLWDALQLCGYDQRPVYVLHPHKTATDVEFSAEIKIVAKPEPKGKGKKASAPATEKPVKKAKAEATEAEPEAPAATEGEEDAKPARKPRAKKSDAGE